MGGSRGDRLAIAALVLVCLLRKADSQSEFRVACLATQVLKQLLCVALSLLRHAIINFVFLHNTGRLQAQRVGILQRVIALQS